MIGSQLVIVRVIYGVEVDFCAVGNVSISSSPKTVVAGRFPLPLKCFAFNQFHFSMLHGLDSDPAVNRYRNRRSKPQTFLPDSQSHSKSLRSDGQHRTLDVNEKKSRRERYRGDDMRQHFRQSRFLVWLRVAFRVRTDAGDSREKSSKICEPLPRV